MTVTTSISTAWSSWSTSETSPTRSWRGRSSARWIALGVGVAVRGFGTGISSMTLMAAEYVDEVHLAPELCRGISRDPLRRSVLVGVADDRGSGRPARHRHGASTTRPTWPASWSAAATAPRPSASPQPSDAPADDHRPPSVARRCHGGSPTLTRHSADGSAGGSISGGVVARFTEEHEMFRKTVRDFVDAEIVPHADEWEARRHLPGPRALHEDGIARPARRHVRPGLRRRRRPTSSTRRSSARSSAGCRASASRWPSPCRPTWPRRPCTASVSPELKERYLRPAIEGRHVAVDRGDRARRRLRRRRDPHQGRPRRRRVGDQRAEALHHRPAPRPTGCACWRGRPTRAATRACRQIVVPTDVAGFSVSRKLDKLGMRSSDTAELGFDDDAGAGLDTPSARSAAGFQQQMQQFQDERMIAAYQMVGAMEGALARTRDVPAGAQGVRRAAARQPVTSGTSSPTSPARSRC